MRTKSNWRVTYIFGVAAVAFLLGSAAYAANPVLTVTGPVHPQAVVPGHGDFILTVDGANFGVGAVVNWNGIPRSTAFVSARELQAKILASDVPKPTAGYITVTNPAPGGGPSSASYAVVEVHQPTSTIVPAPPHYYPLAGNAIEFLVAGDFNDDGKLDLLTEAGSGSVYLLSGKGDGTFKAASVVDHRYYTLYGCTHAVGDFNNDGKLDFIFPAGVCPNSASVQVRIRQWGWYVPNQWEVSNISDVSGPCCRRFRWRRRARLRSRSRRRFRRVHLPRKRGWNLPAAGNL
jgi:hypothetical protein